MVMARTNVNYIKKLTSHQNWHKGVKDLYKRKYAPICKKNNTLKKNKTKNQNLVRHTCQIMIAMETPNTIDDGIPYKIKVLGGDGEGGNWSLGKYLYWRKFIQYKNIGNAFLIYILSHFK